MPPSVNSFSVCTGELQYMRPVFGKATARSSGTRPHVSRKSAGADSLATATTKFSSNFETRFPSVDSVSTIGSCDVGYRIADSDQERFLNNICMLLNDQIALNEMRSGSPRASENTSVFWGADKPEIDLQSYLNRLWRYLDVTPESFAAAMIYLKRLSELHSTFLLTSRNVHRVVLTAVNLGMKYVEDNVYSAADMALLGGLDEVSDLNAMERQLLALLNFELFIVPRELRTTRDFLLS